MEAGFAVIPRILDYVECASFAAELGSPEEVSAGTRNLLGYAWCRTIARRLAEHLEIARCLPDRAVAVQCTLFQKSPRENWRVAFHQDLSIPVAHKVGSVECIGWSEKEGGLYVQPPPSVLEELVAVRLHVDACPAEGGALRLVPGSHLFGRLAREEIARLRRERGECVVPVEQGGALLMKPLILHASSKTSSPAPRRVLHFLFGPPLLPFGVQWKTAV